MESYTPNVSSDGLAPVPMHAQRSNPARSYRRTFSTSAFQVCVISFHPFHASSAVNSAVFPSSNVRYVLHFFRAVSPLVPPVAPMDESSFDDAVLVEQRRVITCSSVTAVGKRQSIGRQQHSQHHLREYQPSSGDRQACGVVVG